MVQLFKLTYSTVKTINVFDDYDIGAVFVESEIDLKFIFEYMKQSEHSIEY